MSLSPVTVIAVLLLGVLFFGKNLPQVVRQVGASLLEFRKGVNEWKDAAKREIMKDGSKEQDTAISQHSDEYKPSGTKFVPPSGSPFE